MAAHTFQTINQLGFDALEHYPYSPDLAPSNYCIFGQLKNDLQGQKFSTDEDVKKAVHK